MGLDVMAVKNAKLIENPTVNEAEDLTKIYHGYFGDQCGDLKDGGHYDYDEHKWFCRMSYGRYSYFRNDLAKIGGWPEFIVPKPSYDDPDYDNKSYYHRHPNVAAIYNQDGDEVEGPFVEVVCFSDCEGFISADFCKKLHADFVNHQSKAEELFSDNESFLNMYNGLRDAFEFGSHSGFVQYT